MVTLEPTVEPTLESAPESLSDPIRDAHPDLPRQDPPRQDPPRQESPRQESPREESAPRSDHPGCRTFRLRRDAAGLERGDLLFVVPGALPEGGEFVVDRHFRLGRHGGGPVWGVVVGMIRRRAARGQP